MKKKKKAIKRKIITRNVATLLPHYDYDYQTEAFILKDKSYMDIVRITAKDLQNASAESVQMDCMQFIKLFRTFGADLKIVALNYPTDTGIQQKYFNHILKRTDNTIYRYFIEEQLDKLEYVQQNMTEREYCLFIYAKDSAELITRRQDVISRLSRSGLVSKLTYQKKIYIQYKMCNQNTRIDLRRNDTMQEFTAAEIEEIGYNPNIIDSIQPLGNCNFSEDDRAMNFGDGYVSCLYIHHFPDDLKMHWLSRLVNINNVICTVDINTESDMVQVRQNINRSISEQSARETDAKDAGDRQDAAREVYRLNVIYDEISSMHEIVKNIRVRLYVSAPTYVYLEERVADIRDELDAVGYKCSVNLNEGEYEWRSLFLPYSEQNNLINVRPGQPFFSETLGGGNPFHFSSLNDENGSFYGVSDSTQGAVMWDLFCKSKNRLSYNAIVFGGMGAGKSTLLKKSFKDRAMRGDFIRGFDVSGEWRDLVREFGGKIVSLDGSDGVLNPLEVLRTADNESICFQQHLSKMATMYRFWVPDTSNNDVYDFQNLLSELYSRFGLLTPEGQIATNKDGIEKITGLPPASYPVFSDLLTLITEKLEGDYGTLDTIQQELKIESLKKLSNIQSIISNLCKNYGTMFDGHTSMDNILDTQIVFFDIQGLAKMGENIFDSQMFSALSLCYDNCVKIGSVMKKGYEDYQAGLSSGICWEDITRFVIYVDEAHRLVNANKLTAVQQLVLYEREARKYFGGIVLASQSVRDFVPDGSSSQAEAQIINLFEFSQYKIIMKQDTNSVDTLARIFRRELTPEEISDVPRFEPGQCILCISGLTNVRYHNVISKEEEILFGGGA